MYQYLTDIQKKRLFNITFAVLLLLAVFLGAEAMNAFKENDYIGRGTYAANVIAVSGTGEVFAVPDTGSLSFSVVEEGKTVAIAQEAASKKINTIIDAIKGLGVAEKDIKTTGYNSYPKYEYNTYPCPMSVDSSGISYPCKPGKSVLTGYEVNQTITVKIRKTADAGKVLTKVGDLGAQNISGLDFVIDNIDLVQAQARDKAIQDAKTKAEVLAKSLGIKLVRIVSFNEGYNQPIYFGLEGKAMSADSSPALTIPQLPTGENKVTSNVTITYEVQ